MTTAYPHHEILNLVSHHRILAQIFVLYRPTIAVETIFPSAGSRTYRLHVPGVTKGHDDMVPQTLTLRYYVCIGQCSPHRELERTGHDMPTEPWMAYIPEVNATRINGPGAFSWVTAATTWGQMAVSASMAKKAFEAQNAIQVATIDGLGSQAIAAKIGPFSEWLNKMEALAMRGAHENRSIGESWVAARTSMIPEAVIAANRAALAAATASAWAAPTMTAEVMRLEAEYSGFWTHNAGTMTSYDEAISAASMPRTYPAPPQLNGGGASGGVSKASDMVNQATSAVNKATQQASHEVNKAISGAKAAMGNPQHVSAAMQSAGAHAAQVMGQIATPVGGVNATGLGGGVGAAMSPVTNGATTMAHGGLPLGMGMGHGMGMAGGQTMPAFHGGTGHSAGGMSGGSAAGLVGGGAAGGSGASSLRGGGATSPSASGGSAAGLSGARSGGSGSGSAASLVRGLGGGNSGGLRGGSLGGMRLGPAFPGVPLGEPAASTSSTSSSSASGARPAGSGAGYGAPMGAAGGQQRKQQSAAGYKASAAETLDDPFVTEQERAERLRMFK